jgi:hypothetical protein
MRIECRIMAIKRRAIGANNFVVVAHVAENVGVIERRQGADAHECPGANLDDGNARLVVEMRNDLVCHVKAQTSRSLLAGLALHHNGRAPQIKALGDYVGAGSMGTALDRAALIRRGT